MKDIRVEVERVLFDKQLGACAILLAEKDGKKSIPIWIGQAEAISIAVQIENVSLPRPITHDLLKKIVDELGAKVEWVKIHDLVDGTFYAIAHLLSNNSIIDVDCRPSDAIALALRSASPIYISQVVFDQAEEAGRHKTSGLSEILDAEYLSSLPDEVFGKYKM